MKDPRLLGKRLKKRGDVKKIIAEKLNQLAPRRTQGLGINFSSHKHIDIRFTLLVDSDDPTSGIDFHFTYVHRLKEALSIALVGESSVKAVKQWLSPYLHDT